MIQKLSTRWVSTVLSFLWKTNALSSFRGHHHFSNALLKRSLIRVTIDRASSISPAAVMALSKSCKDTIFASSGSLSRTEQSFRMIGCRGLTSRTGSINLNFSSWDLSASDVRIKCRTAPSSLMLIKKKKGVVKQGEKAATETTGRNLRDS